MLPVQGRRRFEIFSSGTGPEILLVHPGGPGLTGKYLAGLLRLGGPDLRVILLHPRGVGRSWAPRAGSAFTVEREAADVEAIRRRLGVDRLHLLGYSAGGFAALEFARRYPRRLASLMLCATAGGAPELRDANRRMLASASPAQRRELARYTRRRAFGERGYADLVEQIGRPFQSRFLPAPTPYLGRLSPRVYRAMITRSGDEFALDGTLASWDGRSAYGGIRIPTLVLVGRHDFFYPAARRAARRIRSAELVVLTRSSHLAVLEQPREFREALRSFLRRVMAAHPAPPRGRAGNRRRPRAPGSPPRRALRRGRSGSRVRRRRSPPAASV